VLDSLSPQVAVLDRTGLIVAVNEAWQRFAVENDGKPESIGVGVNYLEVCRRAASVGEALAQQVVDGLEAVLAGSRPMFTLEYTCHSPTEQRWFVLYASLSNHPEGGAITTHLNITGQKQWQAQVSLGGQSPCLGDFRLLREVARGGMGVVYEAEQLSLGRRVALKVLSNACALQAKHLQRFQIEARAAAQLQHPHIVPVYAVGCERGVHYYAMQFINGQTLAALITQLRQRAGLEPPPQPEAEGKTTPAAEGTGLPVKGSDQPTTIYTPTSSSTSARELSPTSPLIAVSTQGPEYFRQVAGWGIQVAEALEHAHQLGIVHRDIKPGNLILDDRGHLWVTDFGVARITTDTGMTMTGELLGTSRYMSPEQSLAQHGLVDHRSDIYSLGVTLYELLTLQPAVRGTGRDEVLHRLAVEEPVLPSRLNRAVPRNLETIVLKAVAKDPQERYRSAGELAGDLQRFLSGRSILARRPPLLQKATRWAQRNTPLVATTVAFCLLALVSLSIGAFLLSDAWQKAEGQKQRAEAMAERSRENERLAWRMLYTTNVSQAGQAWRDGDPLRALDLLAELRPTGEGAPAKRGPDLRGFEWYYLWSQMSPPHTTVEAHAKAVYFLCYSPDGQLLASAGQDAVIRLYDANTFQLKDCFPTGQVEVNGVAFSSDSKRLATAGDDGTVRLWDLANHNKLRSITTKDRLAFQVVFTADDQMLISCGTDPVIRLWDPNHGNLLGTLEGHREGLEAITLAPDGHTLVSAGSDATVKFWNLRTRTLLDTWDAAAQIGGKELSSAVVSPDGKLVAASTLGTALKGLVVWEYPSGELKYRLSFKDDPQSLCFSPDGRYLAVGDRGGIIHLWPSKLLTRNKKPVEDFFHGPPRWKAHDGRVYSLVFTPDGTRLISAGSDGRVKVWTLPGDRSQRFPPGLGMPEDSPDFAFADEDTLVVVHEEGVDQWDLDANTVRRLDAFKGAAWTVAAVSPDGKRLAVGSDAGPVVVRDRETGREVQSWSLKEGTKKRLAFSPTGTRLALMDVTDDQDRLRLLDVASGNVRDVALEFNPGREVVFSPDGRHLVLPSGNDILLYDGRTGALVHRLRGHDSTVRALAFGPRGRRLASVGHDRKLRIWDLAEGKELYSVVAHEQRVPVVAFSADGQTVVTTAPDGSTRFWHVETGRLLLELSHPGAWLPRLVFSSNGRRLAFVNSLTAHLGILNGEPWATSSRGGDQKGEAGQACPQH
jgi:WD40 repeat protein/serine/threonine protein kinase